MTIKDKLKSMKSSNRFPENRVLNFQDMNFEISPRDYLTIYSTKSDYQNKKYLIRVPLYEADKINQSLLQYEFDFFTLEKLHDLESWLDLVFVLNYEHDDNTKLNMNIKYIA